MWEQTGSDHKVPDFRAPVNKFWLKLATMTWRGNLSKVYLESRTRKGKKTRSLALVRSSRARDGGVVFVPSQECALRINVSVNLTFNSYSYQLGGIINVESIIGRYQSGLGMWFGS